MRGRSWKGLLGLGIIAEALAEEVAGIVLGEHVRGDFDFHRAVVVLGNRADLFERGHVAGRQRVGGDDALGDSADGLALEILEAESPPFCSVSGSGGCVGARRTNS